MGSPLPLPEQLKESKKTPTQASFFVEQFFIRCAAADRTDLSCHRRMLARNVWSQRISARI